jgi:enediyne polyketide synthase
MHVPDQAFTGPGQAVAIAGAALRFPGASDPASFHDLTAAGRRMFRELAAVADDRLPSGGVPRGAPAGRRATLAALLDDGVPAFGRDDELTGGITARHILAAETAAAALADVPSLGRAMSRGRVGVFFADIPEPGTADVAGWVRRQLQAGAGGDGGPALARNRKPADGPTGLRAARTSLQDLVIGAIDVATASHGLAPLHGAPVNGAPMNGVPVNGAAFDGAGVSGAPVNGAVVNGTAYGTPAHGAGANGSSSSHGEPSGDQHCSLRAVAAACEALNSGEFDLVLAGGVAKGVGGWARGRGSSARAARQVRVYDASPTGTLPGEGCGVVVLMRAADARAAGVPGYAEIAGWHYAGPGASQQAVLPEAYLRAGIDPADIQLVEGHGAATAADDLAELSALLEVLGSRGGGAGRCALGSVSANIGDTRAAAGIAALLKAAFAMTADTIPPSTGCVQPNRLLRGARAPFRLPSAAEEWPQTPVQLAAVNTLGTAAYPDAPRSGPVHVVLRRERDPAHRPGRRRKPASLSGTAGGGTV